MISKSSNIYNRLASFLRPCLYAVLFAVASGNTARAQDASEQITTLYTIGDTTTESKPASARTTALRTNLLADLLGAVNVGVEFPVGGRFSVAADLMYAHTRIGNFTIQGFQGSLEGRYWFGRERNKPTGWNVGIYATYCSRFDLQLGGGYQGDGFFSVGASAGYSVSLSNRLSLDFSLMAGYQYLPELRKYGKPENCCIKSILRLLN